MAARHGEIHTAIGWSAGLPDRRERGERIGSPMPGNLPDNGMWPFNNIHKYSDEAKWGCPRDCAVQAVSSMCKKKQRRRCCVGVLRGRGRDLFLPCSESRERGGDIVRFCWAFFDFKYEPRWAYLLFLNGLNKHPTDLEKWCMRVRLRPRFTSTTGVRCSFPSKYVLEPQLPWQRLATF